MHKSRALAFTAVAATLLAACATAPSSGPMSFFITSAGSGKGADLGGLAGADAHCQRLASAANAGGKTWRAYLSVPGAFAQGGSPLEASPVMGTKRTGRRRSTVGSVPSGDVR